MTKYICEKAKECDDEHCGDRTPHEHDEWCSRGCDSTVGKFPEAKCIMVNPTGAELIAEERKRQIEKEGWTAEHDEQHGQCELALASACYAVDYYSQLVPLSAYYHNWAYEFWPWHEQWWKPTPDNPIKQLTKAGALIAAEIDRLQRQKEKENA